MTKETFFNLKKSISKEKRIIKEIEYLSDSLGERKFKEEIDMIRSQLELLKHSLKKINEEMLSLLKEVSIKESGKKLVSKESEERSSPNKSGYDRIPKEVIPNKEVKKKKKDISFLDLFKQTKKYSQMEKDTIKRFGNKKEKKIEKKERKPSKYVNLSTRIFADFSRDFIKRGYFKKIRKDLIRANLYLVDASYISTIFLTVAISIIAGIFIFLFLLFFEIGGELPIITLFKGSFIMRTLKLFWIIPALPITVFIFMYYYPSLERMSLKDKIESELPFATIHMSAVSSSMVDPSRIFDIIVATKEYPNLEKEFRKLLNEINVYGYDLVSALRSVSYNTPSLKLKELFNGLVVTINSGGDLQEFFDKRSESLLFEYKIEREKYTKTAETFMDIYISVVIAAPMILMLLVVMMKISGLGISLSTNMITLIMVLSISMVNIFFLTFLHLKQSSK
jgi:archaeal flagellar protein FlaJ